MERLVLTEYEIDMLLRNKVKSVCVTTDRNNEIEIKIVR